MNSAANHNEVKELVDHLEERLSTVTEAEPDYHAWSDGDQIRALAHSMLKTGHEHLHAIPGAIAVDVQVPRALLRIAARLDTLDEEEGS